MSRLRILLLGASLAAGGCTLFANLDDIPLEGEVGADAHVDGSAGDALLPEAGASDSSDDGRVEVFTYTGAVVPFVVPEGVTTISVKLWGASGGCIGQADGGIQSGSGGFAKNDAIAVTPGEALDVIVGGPGTGNIGPNPGGFGGGGSGSNHPMYRWSASGGGRSSIARGNTDVIVAGGGGGCGYGPTSPGTPPLSGSGGSGCAAADGSGGDATGKGGGKGASPTVGGSGGTAASGTTGHPGTLHKGGNSLYDGNKTSGGGGGGVYGGGGGAWAVSTVAGAGGGGSGIGPAGTLFDPAGGVSEPEFEVTIARGTPLENGLPGKVVIRW